MFEPSSKRISNDALKYYATGMTCATKVAFNSFVFLIKIDYFKKERKPVANNWKKNKNKWRQIRKAGKRRSIQCCCKRKHARQKDIANTINGYKKVLVNHRGPKQMAMVLAAIWKYGPLNICR